MSSQETHESQPAAPAAGAADLPPLVPKVHDVVASTDAKEEKLGGGGFSQREVAKKSGDKKVWILEIVWDLLAVVCVNPPRGRELI